MILARVVGTIVATRKDPRLEGFKLLIVKPVAPDGKDESGYVIAVDTVSAGSNETVIVVSGSSARMAGYQSAQSSPPRSHMAWAA